MVPKWYPKWYPSGTQTLLHILSNGQFLSFLKSKNGLKATLIIILGTIPDFWVPLIIFLEHIPSQLPQKKTGSLTRIIYLPSLKLLIFGQMTQM